MSPTSEEIAISFLAIKSLKEKWYLGSKVYLSDSCPFCRAASSCIPDCLCPIEICHSGKWTKRPLVQKILNKYVIENSQVCDILLWQLVGIRDEFKKHIIGGWKA